jgi:DNA-directed RNA polymerase III subunit RPC8
VTNTAKGVQATTTTTAQSAPQSDRARALSTGSADGEQPVRKRSSSFDLSDSQKFPASMQIVASICEDGLGLTSWWASQNEEEELEEE